MSVIVRTVIFAFALHLYGGPQFDDLRPNGLDRPLKQFHREATVFVSGLVRDVSSIPMEVRAFAGSTLPRR